QRDGTLFLVAVGIDKYSDKRLGDLKLSAKDANDFAEAMLRQRGTLYQDVVVRVLTDEKATRADLIRALEWLREQVGENDVGMVFLAGHGANDSNGGYQFVSSDADLSRLEGTGLPDRLI